MLNAYSMVLFTSKKRAGAVLLLTTFLDPFSGLSGLLGVLFTNSISSYLGVYKEKVRKGLYGFNGLLLGLALNLYHDPTPYLFLVLFASCILLVIITIWLEGSLGYYYGLPVLSLPFVVVTFLVYMAFFNYHGIPLKSPSWKLELPYPGIPVPILAYFKSLGSIFFQSSPYAGVIVGIVLFAVSRISFFLSILGFAAGSLFQVVLGGNLSDITGGLVGFNYILTAIALGGIFLVPSPNTFFLATIASVSVALVASFTKIFFYFFNLPVLSFPFTLVTLLFLYTTKQLRNSKFKIMDLLPGSPEENLDYYNTRLRRFGGTGLYVKLPFMGLWKVSQGYHGKYTHREEWYASLDFMAVGGDGKLRKGQSDGVSDYHTFGLPVLAVAAGRVVKIVNHMEDNRISEVRADREEKWGNLVILEHLYGIYSQVSHLKKDSITVKEGEYVAIGAKLGLAGSSGRSPEPHIHLHFQAGPEIGSPTIEIPFTQFLQNRSEREKDIYFNAIPPEGEVVSNLIPEMNFKNFFALPPGARYKLESTYQEKKKIEIWRSEIDLFGGRYLEDEAGNLLYFFLGNDYYASLDYQGETNSALYSFFLASYRVPFLSVPGKFGEAMTYKHLSGFFSVVAKDLIAPFSDILSYRWEAEVGSTAKLKSLLQRNNGEILFQGESEFSGKFPGLVVVTDSQGRERSVRFV